MHEHIDEPIAVIVSFREQRVLPRRFLWRNKEYVVERVSMVHAARQGRDMLYYFSVTDGVNFFRLKFATRDLVWFLDEMYTEG